MAELFLNAQSSVPVSDTNEQENITEASSYKEITEQLDYTGTFPRTSTNHFLFLTDTVPIFVEMTISVGYEQSPYSDKRNEARRADGINLARQSPDFPRPLYSSRLISFLILSERGTARSLFYRD